MEKRGGEGSGEKRWRRKWREKVQYGRENNILSEVTEV